jgi:hypothetical protein
MKTYEIKAPVTTHFRIGTCAEAQCRAHVNGWRTAVDESTDLGRGQAHYIRHSSGRKYVESRTEDGLTAFEFEAGQTCFRQHQVRIERPELFVVREGDWRGNPRGFVRRHNNADDWVDDFANHQATLADRLKEG